MQTNNNFAPLSKHQSGAGSVGLLSGSAPSSFDHIRYGRQFTHFRYPAKVEGFVPFKDALLETIPGKIKQVTVRMKKLEAERKKNLQGLAKCYRSRSAIGTLVPLDKTWFVDTYADARFEEYEVCQKWLNYWLAIWDELSGKRSVQGLAVKLDLARAKQYPIENLYTGQLRKFGGRLTGLCPFHEEKTPSFVIFPDNSFFCFGCNAFGDSVDFLMKLKGCDFKEAVRSLT